MPQVTSCRHCGEDITPFGQYGFGCWAAGWVHVRLVASMLTGSHFCGGRADGPLAEPEPAAAADAGVAHWRA